MTTSPCFACPALGCLPSIRWPGLAAVTRVGMARYFYLDLCPSSSNSLTHTTACCSFVLVIIAVVVPFNCNIPIPRGHCCGRVVEWLAPPSDGIHLRCCCQVGRKCAGATVAHCVHGVCDRAKNIFDAAQEGTILCAKHRADIQSWAVLHTLQSHGSCQHMLTAQIARNALELCKTTERATITALPSDAPKQNAGDARSQLQCHQ